MQFIEIVNPVFKINTGFVLIIVLSLMLLYGCASSSRNVNSEYPAWVQVVALDDSNVENKNRSIRFEEKPSQEKPSQEKLSYEKLITEKILTIKLKVEFEFAKAIVRDEYSGHLKEVAAFMLAHHDTKITIEGHTCSIGTEKNNMILSLKRTESIKKYLVDKYGIDSSRLNTSAFGETRPIADNSTEDGRKQNRRTFAVITTSCIDEIPETIKPVLLFDYLDKPLNQLIDYSNPRGKAGLSKPVKGKTNKTGAWKNLLRSTGVDRRDYLGKWGGRSDGDNVNILINNPKEEKPAQEIAKSDEVFSRVEQLYNKYGELTLGKKIRQFGYDLTRFHDYALEKEITQEFIRSKQARGVSLQSQDPSTRLFAATKRASASFQTDEYAMLRPALSKYIIASGDQVWVKITGTININEVFTVDRNGWLFLPQVGGVNLAGRNASELQTLISSRVSEVFKNAKVEASLGRLRTIDVTVTGNVLNPGLLQIAANSSMFKALLAAGGPSKNGTLRDVILRRRNMPEQHVDIYGLLLDGDWAEDPILLPGDIIYVGPIGKTVALLSPGDKGAIYEIRDGSTLKKLVDRIGITGSFTDIETVLVERSAIQSDREIEAINYKRRASSFKLSDGDIFQFFPTHPYAYNNLEISGPVLRPGIYPFKEGMRVSDLLNLSRGFLVHASLGRALLIRELGVNKNFDIMPDDQRGKHRNQLIWLDLARILSGDVKADIPLSRIDRLKIFTTKDTQPEPMVNVLGAVRSPGKFRLTAGMTLGDLLEIAGGPLANAFEGNNSIVRRRYNNKHGKHNFDVEIISFDLKDVIEHKKVATILLENQDKIIIRQVNNLESSVVIDGWVQFPGTYIMPFGSKIDDFIRMAGGLLEGADLRAAVFKRQRLARRQWKSLESYYANTTERLSRIRDEVVRAGHASESFANQLGLLGQDRIVSNMEKFQTTGRIVIDLTDDKFVESDDNLILENGDSLAIPQKMNSVIVMGRIFNPCAYIWKEPLTVEDYLEKSGGYLEDADKEHVYILMANGEVKSAAQKGGKNALLDFQPLPGDIVFVPQEPLGRSAISQFSDIIQVIRSIAELGIIGAAIPNASDTDISIDLSGGSTYDPLNSSPPSWQEMKGLNN